MNVEDTCEYDTIIWIREVCEYERLAKRVTDWRAVLTG